jgi:NAD(P)H-dependent flavin oxidoreductase YrpB (nitropropane dioxygenase family)
VLIQRAMVEGFPDEGVLPSGQVAASISKLQSCAEVIDGIVEQANRCLSGLCSLQVAQGAK